MVSRWVIRAITLAFAVPLSTLGLVLPASAYQPTGEYAVFKDCPLAVSHIDGCVYSVTTSGEVTIAGTTVPIVNPIVFQGGETREVIGTGESRKEVRKFVGAENGETLSKTPQPVPGGLADLVKCPEISNSAGRLACEVVFENAATGVNATTELVGEPDYKALKLVSHKVGLIMPVRVHLENPLLGNECYIGSASEPITFRMTTGTTSPPPPNKPISGELAGVSVLNGGALLTIETVSVVDNSFSVPTANGCGGPLLSSELDSIIDSKLGIPSAAGVNTARLNGHAEEAVAGAVIQSEGPEATAEAARQWELFGWLGSGKWLGSASPLKTEVAASSPVKAKGAARRAKGAARR